MDGDFFQNIKKTISQNRLSTYTHHFKTDKSILENYILNAKISESFYFPLQNLEVALRNAIYDNFKIKYPANDFFFLHESDPRKRYLKRKEKHTRECWKMVCGAKHNLTRHNIFINDGKIIAELNFGFWTKILASNDNKYTNMWRHIFPLVFPNYTIKHSIDTDRLQVGQIIDNIRELRNRVFHYEPIFNQTDLDKIHTNIRKVLGWINTDLQTMTKMFDRYDNIEKEKNFISKQLAKKQ